MPSISQEVTHRVEIANRFMVTISQCGAQIFRNPTSGRTGRFERDRLSRIWFIDPHSGARIHLHPRHPWVDFSGPPHERAFLKAMRSYIIYGNKLNPFYFAKVTPTGRAHAWGYGDDIDDVCACGQALGLIARHPAATAELAD